MDLAVDRVSMEFLKGSTIEFAEDLIASSFRVCSAISMLGLPRHSLLNCEIWNDTRTLFQTEPLLQVKDNPNSEQSCGCGTSFAAKMD